MFETRPGSRFHAVRPLVMILLLLVWAGTVSAQNVSSGGEGLKVTGFVDFTAFLQNQNFTFGNGQNAEFPNPPETKNDRWFLDGDARNTRLTLAFAGPKLANDAKVGATVEADFFGGFNGTGAFSNAQATPRLRLAFVDYVRGRNTFRLGQVWSPLLGNVAASYSHMAFPLGYGSAGEIGWRFPGLVVIRDMTPAGSATTSKFTLAVLRNTWNGPGNNVDSGSAGQASTLPQVEARLDFGSKKWSTYFVVHVDKKDLSGAGVKSSNDSLTGWAGEFGAKITSGSFTLAGNAYTGKAVGQHFGQMTQFGDIKSWGIWVQPGVTFSKTWTGYVFIGTEKANKDDVLAAKAARIKNLMIAPSLMYNLGPYGFNVEWLHDSLTTGATEVKTSGDQFAVSAIYKF